MSTWTSSEIVRRALQGRETPRAAVGPLAVHFCAQWAGASLREYTLDPATLAESVLRYYERFRPDAVWISADTWVSAQAMGARVAFPGQRQPMAGTGEPVVRTAADVDRLPRPDVGSQGRYPLMLEALRRVVERLGGEAFVVACMDQYPFSLACSLMGMERLMLALWDDRPLAEALIERCAEYTIAYATALADAGADMLSGGDSPAGLIGPKLYAEVALPAAKRVIAAIKSHTSVPVSLHVCGRATPILDQMAASGADVLEIDQQVDLATACRIVGPDVALWGNLDPVGLLVRGTPEQVRAEAARALGAVRRSGHDRFVLSSGCTLAVDTPAANVDALIEAACGAAPSTPSTGARLARREGD